MSVLLIDDTRVFQPRVLEDLFEQGSVYISRTDADAIVLLQAMNEDLDQVFFDFDLGTVGGEKITSLVVAKYLAHLAEIDEVAQAGLSKGADEFLDRRERKPRFRVGQMVLHTSNPVGREQLRAILEPHFQVVEVDGGPGVVFDQMSEEAQEMLQVTKDYPDYVDFRKDVLSGISERAQTVGGSFK